MQLHGWTLLLQAVNLAVLLALLRWLLYAPLLRVIEARRQAVQVELEGARQAQQQAQTQADALAAERSALQASQAELLTSARLAAEAERQGLQNQARQAAQAALAQARQQVQRERQDASAELLSQAADLAQALAARLLAASPCPAGDSAFAHALLDRLEASPLEIRRGWLLAPGGSTGGEQQAESSGASEQGGTGGAGAAGILVRLLCAGPLSAQDQQALIERLRALLLPALGAGHDLRLELGQDAALIRGAELHVPHGLFRLNWAAELEAARAAMAQPAAETRAEGLA